MVKNLYVVLVVVSRVAGLYLCTNAFIAAVSSGLIWFGGHPRIQSSFAFALIVSFIIGAALLFSAKPIARALTSDLD